MLTTGYGISSYVYYITTNVTMAHDKEYIIISKLINKRTKVRYMLTLLSFANIY
jgi:hypothetical protein